MGDVEFDDVVESGYIVIRAPAPLARRIPSWLGQHRVLGAIGPAAPS
jgi:hypothetical protein